MLKKILSACLAVFIFTAVSGVNAFARANNGEGEQAKQEKQIDKKDSENIFKTKSASADALEKSAYSRAEYDRQKAQGNKFSTKTKVLIGVGIAAAAIGIFVIAASRDKIRPF